MNTVRTPAVAGMFYPDNANELRMMVRNFLNEPKVSNEPVPKAIIAPHAGYIYSGPIAASVYARLVPAHDTINRVILLGPSHRVSFPGLAATGMTHFVTPLGTIRVDRIDEITSFPQVSVLEQAHTNEHSLEVQLPFLQAVLDDFSFIPLVVGEASPEQIEPVLEKLWGGSETVIVISSDLSHYHDYETAKKMDQLTSQAIENLRPEAIHHEQACGGNPVNGLLQIARRKKMHAKTIDLRNSGDTAGQKNQVVGYGAYVFN
ncbi:MAG: AmmeMemoRadiSam system protein B [Gammaproteobacteria bacterium]|nr:MAG: AmmeMemoRadiSam system protein B [Gammaproteobacteria bacterium]RKZ44920.1 MAG: AmmeMemoRadiSam system protein B [Gammaproteobacteria bacterium]RKZ76549.1 MAG: AmmeMemoRadiSam system protein B [Gammaproteobacteria bacterium]